MAEDEEIKGIKLTVDSVDYPVVSCSFGAYQSTGIGGKPTGRPYWHEIHIVIQSTESTVLLEWAVKNKERKDGTITFPRFDTVGTLKTLEFKDGIISNYTESSGGEHLMMSITLSAREINVGNAKLKNDWPSTS